MKHLLTFLRHGVSATSASTVGSPSFDRRGTMLKHLAFMLLFLLGSLNVWGETITFKTTTGTEGSTNITSSTNESNILTAGAEYIAFTNKCVKAYYPGKLGLKLGSGSATGTVAFTLSLSNITSITIKTAKYGSDKGTLTFKRGTNSLQTGQTPGNDIVQTFSPAITPGEDVFTIATSEKRAYISEIIVETSSGPAQPTVSVTPENITWEGIAANAEKSEEITVTLSNIEAVMAELSGDNPTAFSIDNNYLETSGKIIVSKNTTTIGNYAATLTISDADTQTKTIALSMEVVADPEPTGTFEKFTGTIEEGDYVLVANGTTDALKNTITSDRFDCGTVEVTENKIVNPDKSVIWHIAANDAYWTMYNESTTSYAGGTASKNQGALLDAVTDLAKWTITVDGEGVYTFENYGRSQQKSDSGNKFLSKNGQNAYWATYASGQKNPVLYKKHVDVAVEKPTISGETSFLTSTTVTLACETEGATIYYTTDESDPRYSETKQTGTSFTLYNSATVRAIANKGDDWSEEATSKTFTKITPDYTTIAAFLSEKPNEDKYIQFAGNVVVTGVNGKNVFIQDESGNAICLYFAANSTWTKGHKVTGMFQAKYATYGNMPEMSIADGNEGTIAATETAALPDPIEITSLEEATINANMCKYVVLKGVYFQGQSLTNKTVNLQDASSNVLKFYDNLSLTEGKALPLTATACDVTGVLISYKSGKDNINEILPVDVACINAGPAALPTLSTAGSTDEEHPTMVANGESITITPAEGFTSTLNGEPLNAATNISITKTESNTVIAVLASRDYYATANATYYFKANPAGTKYAITVVQPEQGGTLEANFAETEAGNPVTLTATPTNSHFTFDGWVVKKTGEPEAIPETVTENQFSMPEYNVTVTGSFTEEGKATLTFAKGEADGEEAAPEDIVNYIGETVQLPANLFTYTGHKFAGWSCDGGTTKLAAGVNYTLVGDKAFVAQWDEIPTFDNSGYEWQLVTSDAQLVAGKYYVIASTAKGKVMSNTISSNVAGEIAATFTDGVIAYNAFGSSQSADAAGVAVLQLGGKEGAWTLTEVVANDALLGATAVKKIAWGSGTTTWSISFANNNATIQNGTSEYGRFLHNVNDTRFTTYTSNTSASMLLPQLYVWAEKVYKLRYDANGGKNAPAAQAADGEGKATVTDAKPTKEDYIFKEWNTLIGGDGEAKAAGDVIDLSEGDVTLYAQWRTPENVTVSYDANGGEGTMEADADQVEGSTYTIKTNTFERNGYLFVGWKAYDANDDELTITNGKFIVPATNVTLKAQWHSATDSKWVLVEYLSQLADGDHVIIAAAGYDYALGAASGSVRTNVAVTKTGKLLSVPGSATELILGRNGNDFTFKDGTKYLNWASGNNLTTSDEVNNNSTWNITIENNATTIANKATAEREIQYNAQQPRFAAYTGSQKAVVIYKYLDIDPEDATSGYEREDLVLSGIGTICLPYDVKASDRFGGVFYMPSHKTSGFANFVEETGTLRAGKAYIFVAENEFIRLKYSGNEVSEPLSNVADTRGLIGTFTGYGYGYTGNLEHKYVVANNKLMECGSGAWVNPYRAYLDLEVMPEEALVINDGPGAAPRRRLGIGGNAPTVPTGFENVQGDNGQCTKVLINGELFILRGEKMYDAKGQLVK